MKRITMIMAVLAAVAFTQTGCVGTVAPTPYGRAMRLAIWQDTQANIEWAGTNQVFKMNGYSGKVDAAALNVLGQVMVSGLAEYMGKNATAQAPSGFTQNDVDAMIQVAVSKALSSKAASDAACADGSCELPAAK